MDGHQRGAQSAMLQLVVALLLQSPAAALFIPARLVTATAPLPPANAVEGTCVLAEVPFDTRGRIGEITIVHGLGPFNQKLLASFAAGLNRSAEVAISRVHCVVGA